MNYLESHGWRVLIFSSMHGNILIEGLKKYERLIIPSLYMSPSCYRKKEVKRTITRIINEIGSCNPDDCIIESDITQRAVWGELIASQLQCRHLCMLVQEKYNKKAEPDSLLQFKYDRHELACISKTTVQQLFGEDEDTVRSDARFIAYCNNVIQGTTDNYSTLINPNADFTFGSLGRLDKPCVPFIVEAFCRYAQKHPNKTFNVIMIGGSLVKGKEGQVRKVFSKCSNVHLVLTGNVYPIPLSFAQKFDVFVSTAGAAMATYYSGIPTVKVNPITGDSVGVIGLDYMRSERNMYKSMDNTTIEDSINNALNNKERIIFEGARNDEYEERMRVEFQRQLTFVDYTNLMEYYPEEKLMRIKTPSHFPQYFLWMIGHFFSPKGRSVIWKMIRN